MPEGPEVHLIAKQIRREVGEDEVVASDYPCLIGKKLDVYALGKKIILRTPEDDLVLSLGMDSRFSLNKNSSRFGGHKPNLLLQTEKVSIYWKIFRFGSAEVNPTLKVGPDLLTETPSPEEWYASLQKRKRKSLALFLLDQEIWSGVGNYIRSEAFFLSGVNPLAKCGDLSREESDALFEAILSVMRDSLRLGSSSGYSDLYGRKGKYEFKCYGREDMEKITVSNRSIYVSK